MDSGWALISGTSTGIGRAVALQLVRNGFNVIAGIRKESDGESFAKEISGLTSSHTGRLVPVLLDVTDEASIRAAVDIADSLTEGKGLRAVVNNAGIVVPGPVEHVSASDWRRQFDVNFFGMIELTRGTLPLLRKAVITYGPFVPRLLFVSSIGGRVAQPMLAPYTSSKFATTALGDSLRLELRGQRIGVSVIEPGAIATAIWAKGDVSAQDFAPNHPARKLYNTEIDGLTAAAKRIASRATPSERAARDIVQAITARRPPARVLIGLDAKITARLKQWLPTSMFDAILRREFGMG